MKFIYFFFLVLLTSNLYGEEIITPLSIKYQQNTTLGFDGIDYGGGKLIGRKYENGVVNGVRYHRYEYDAKFESIPEGLTKGDPLYNQKKYWRVSCDSDDMTDKKSCSIYEEHGNVFIQLNSKGTVIYLSIFGHDDFPDEKAIIRIGNSLPVNAAFIRGKRARSIVKKLKKGTLIRTRYYDFPDIESYKYIIYGLKEAMDYAKWVLGEKPHITTTVNTIKTHSNSHTHGGRSHSHPLPKEGIGHRHGNSARGK